MTDKTLRPIPAYDVAVIGGGAIGLGAAYAATKRGLRTIIIDKFDIPNQLGSSRGLERIFRVMYAQKNRTTLAQNSWDMWRDIEKASGETILIKDDLIFFGYKNAPETPEGNLADIRKTMDALDIPYEFLDSPHSIARRFPVFNPSGMPDDYIGLVQSSQSATIDVLKATRTLLNLANDTGYLTIAGSSEVLYMNLNSSYPFSDGSWSIGVRPSTAGSPFLGDSPTGPFTGVLDAKYLIMAPGVWAKSLVQSDYTALKQSQDFRIWQMTFAYWKKCAGAGEIPLWYEFGNSGNNDNGLFYGFPEVGLNDETSGRVKISADYAYGDTIYKDPSEITGRPDGRIISDIQRHMSNLFVDGTIDLDDFSFEKACLYSMAGDYKIALGGFPMGQIDRSRFASSSMCIMAAGRAFKFTPVFGEILLDVAMSSGEAPNYGTQYDDLIEEFSPYRSGVFEPWKGGGFG